MVFLDSAYLISLLMGNDPNHNQAKSISTDYLESRFVISQAVIGEVLTVGSLRYDKKIAINFVENIHQSNTQIILESADLIAQTLAIFKQVTNKNISYVDCYSAAIINQYKIDTVLTFDRDFLKLKPFLPKNVAFPLL